MKDIELYKEIGQILFNVTPDPSKPTNIVFLKDPSSTGQTWWNGEFQSRDTSFLPPR